jgi:hypothetical protein
MGNSGFTGTPTTGNLAKGYTTGTFGDIIL